jgi:hypothetical protein
LVLNKNIKILLNSIVGPLVFLLLSYSIYREILRQPNWRGSLDQLGHAISGPQQWRLWLVLALMPLNWGIEARKWQLALRPVGQISYRNAYRAIFTGVTMASFTPNRMGEYLGRMLYVDPNKRLSSISLTILCSIAQLLITLVVGLGGIFWLRHSVYLRALPEHHLSSFWLDVLLGLTIPLCLGLTFIYFRLSWLIRILDKFPVLSKRLSFIKVLGSCDAPLLVRILFLSFFRYLVFLLQYLLVFPVFGVFLGTGQVVWGMSLVFLVMAIVPTFTFLTELGLRWEVSIQVLELFSRNTLGIFAVSLGIWLINLIIPALIGSLLILGIKLFKSK